MGKQKQKNHREDEHLLGQIRALKSENRNLKKRLRYLEKYHNDDAPEKEERTREKVNNCKECGRGELKDVILVGRKFQTCDTCNWRSKATKI